MKHLNLIFTLVTTLGVSTCSFAGDRNNSQTARDQLADRNSYNSQRSHAQSNRPSSQYQKHNGNNYSNHRGNGQSYNQNRHNSSRHGQNSGHVFNSPYRNGHRNNDYYRGNRYSNQNRYNYYNHGHGNNHGGHHNYYNNYKPYANNHQYMFRPLRGLGHYFHRTGYGYGHWHDNMWCAVNHPQSYYYDYYSNYQYDGGWRFGDGDFGIWFNF
jgi:hypothetical protein